MNPVEQRTLPLRQLERPEPGCIDVWSIRQDRLPLAGLGMLAATTDGEEGRRMRRMQQRFVLRLLLGAYLDRPGRDVAIVRSAAGKPELVGDAARQLAFSLSHTGPWLALAVSSGVPVGIDIEPADRRPRWKRLAQRYFPSDEAERLCGCGDEDGCRRFLNHWTAREALIKAAGRTLAGNVGEIRLVDDGPLSVDRLPAEWPAPSRWGLSPLAVDPNLVGHVAWAAPEPPSVRHFELVAPG